MIRLFVALAILAFDAFLLWQASGQRIPPFPFLG